MGILDLKQRGRRVFRRRNAKKEVEKRKIGALVLLLNLQRRRINHEVVRKRGPMK